MRAIAIVLALLTSAAHAESRASSTVLTLRGKGKPTRLLVKKVELEILRNLAPCSLRLVVTPQHAVFRGFSINIGYDATSSGAIKNGKSWLTAEVLTVGTTDAITTKGHVFITRRPKVKGFDAKVDVSFDQGTSRWTLAGVVRIDDAACLWDAH